MVQLVVRARNGKGSGGGSGCVKRLSGKACGGRSGRESETGREIYTCLVSSFLVRQ